MFHNHLSSAAEEPDEGRLFPSLEPVTRAGMRKQGPNRSLQDAAFVIYYKLYLNKRKRTL